jgi:hypothetical protein
VVVSDVQTGDDSISFSVDQIGVPVLVKASYFPNWQVEGAAGPYRVAPNYMVVVPTSNHVTLTYGTSPIEYLGYLLTLVGIGLLFVLWRKGPVRYEPVADGAVVWKDGELRWHDEPSLELPPEMPPTEDVTADHDRFEVLADQVFGPSQAEVGAGPAPPMPLPPPPPPPPPH